MIARRTKKSGADISFNHSPRGTAHVRGPWPGSSQLSASREASWCPSSAGFSAVQPRQPLCGLVVALAPLPVNSYTIIVPNQAFKCMCKPHMLYTFHHNLAVEVVLVHTLCSSGSGRDRAPHMLRPVARFPMRRAPHLIARLSGASPAGVPARESSRQLLRQRCCGHNGGVGGGDAAESGASRALGGQAQPAAAVRGMATRRWLSTYELAPEQVSDER